MYGLTRAGVTLIASAVAGFLIWVATQIGHSSNGDYWATYGVIAAAGLVMALSQLLGGWTKWGWPRISLHVFLWAFVPVAIAVLWIVIFNQPHHGLGRNHILKLGAECLANGSVKIYGLRDAHPMDFDSDDKQAGAGEEIDHVAGSTRWKPEVLRLNQDQRALTFFTRLIANYILEHSTISV